MARSEQSELPRQFGQHEAREPRLYLLLQRGPQQGARTRDQLTALPRTGRIMTGEAPRDDSDLAAALGTVPATRRHPPSVPPPTDNPPSRGHSGLRDVPREGTAEWLPACRRAGDGGDLDIAEREGMRPEPRPGRAT
ncbi:hypothetical protein DUI70_4460 [Streptomyces albus]|nr:hypothetical protein SLNHY_4535 [Streptomyces albus]AYN34956.1 hypothetical protein DUI70_4460 [Streptomyces albus]